MIRLKHICIFILVVFATQSCGVLNTLTKRKKDNYVNYNLLFADPAANNALRNKAINRPSDDNRVRVITINQITGDTIIEWLRPMEANRTSKTILPVKDLTNKTVSATAATPTQQALEQNHKAIIISYTDADGPMSYKVINDTVYISTDSQSANRLLISLANKQFAEDLANNKKPNRTNGLRKVTTKNEEVSNKFTNDNIKSNINAPRALLANTNSIVGDLMFDTDNKAVTIQDLDSINEILKNNIIEWETYKCKARVKVKNGNDTKSFNITMRLLQDSLTWASVNLLGLELVRAKISKENIRLMDYTKDKYFEYNPNQLDAILDIPIAFNTLQNFIIGNPPISPSSSMLAKKSSKGWAVKIIADGSNSVFTYNADSTLKAVVIVTNKGGKSYSINGAFSDYQNSPLGKVSTRRDFTIIENKKVTHVEVNLTKFDFDANDLEFPYKIPEKFKKGN